MPRLPRLLDPTEARVLGSLLEKKQATPEAYPLTLHALRAACNQTTNREPVLALSDDEVLAALERLREYVLVWKTSGARSEKWEENLTAKLGLDAAQTALLTLLLLRGEQTSGELRARSERLHPFLGIAEVERTLGTLAAGPDPIASEVPRRPGQKEARWRELVTEEGPDPAPGAEPRAAAPDRLTAVEERLAALEAELAALKSRLGD